MPSSNTILILIPGSNYNQLRKNACAYEFVEHFVSELQLFLLRSKSVELWLPHVIVRRR